MFENYIGIHLHVLDLEYPVAVKVVPGCTDKGTFKIGISTVEVFLDSGGWWHTHLSIEEQHDLETMLFEKHIARARIQMLKEEAGM